jgi:hypothetical protein
MAEAPTVPVAPPPVITTGHTALFGGDDSDILCHWVRPDGTAYCGFRWPPGSSRGRHKSDDPTSNPCDGCGYPRCPACDAVRSV